jgi:hypothetical protein
MSKSWASTRSSSVNRTEVDDEVTTFGIVDEADHSLGGTSGDDDGAVEEF